MTSDKQYNPGIDALKFIAVISIVLFHFADKGVVDLKASEITLNWVILSVCKMGGGLGNCIFALITGWLSVNRNFDARKILKLCVQVWIASVIGQIAYCGITGTMPGMKDLVKTVFPITLNTYWYFSSYIVIYMLMPYINKTLDEIGRRQHKVLSVILFVLFSVIPTFTTTKWLVGINQIAMMITLYVFGNYCRRYIDKTQKMKMAIIICLSGLFIFLSELAIRKFTSFDPYYFTWEMNKTPIVVFSTALFLLGVTSRSREYMLVKIISKHAFGIYLIHIGWIRPLLFKRLFANDKYYTSPVMSLQMVACLLIVIAACVAIDYVYWRLYNSMLAKTVNRLGEKVNAYYFGC
ncbi:MAG: acyltransferase [Synergistaceae bacterium]|nr:acyltransferase [Synergistaceae bacterium]